MLDRHNPYYSSNSPRAFLQVRERHLLGAESESCAGDGCGQVETFGDLPPDLLVDNFHQASLLCHKLVQLVEVQHLLRHDGNAIHRSSWMEERINTIKYIPFLWILLWKTKLVNVRLPSALVDLTHC